MEIKVRIAEEKDVERVAMLYEKLHDYLETHENHPRWIRGIYPTKVNAQEGFEKGWLYVAEIDGQLAGSVIYLHEQGEVYNQVKPAKKSQYFFASFLKYFSLLKLGTTRGLSFRQSFCSLSF